MTLRWLATLILRLLAAGASLGMTDCAHRPPEYGSLADVERALREACMPFVIDGDSYSDVGRGLGSRWMRNFPDPFTPPAGPIFRNGSLRLQVVDGRAQRNADGSLTTNPVRTCNIWMEAQDEASLVSAVLRAAASDTRMKIVSDVGGEPTLRILGCIPLERRAAILRTSTYADGSLGAGVYETPFERAPAACGVQGSL